MELRKESSKFFKEEYYLIGDWSFKSANSTPHVKVVAADTETKMYYNGNVLSDDKAYKLLKNNNRTWFRQNVEVKAYAYMLACEDNFALFQNCEDFITACAMMNVKYVFWYNARFDFALFDYYFLTNEWTEITESLEQDHRYRKMPTKTYQSLNSDYGQRYQMRIWKEYINRRSQRKVHNFKMLDICNIYAGGLAKNLKDWNITDKAGNAIRKLDMEYAAADLSNENDIKYMFNDTVGLYYLAAKIRDTIYESTGNDLFAGDYMTAGGLAKKTMLSFMFSSPNYKHNKRAFKDCFPMTVEEDQIYRASHLYLGGMCFVNKDKIGIKQHTIYKYDVNSMYPDKMRNMRYPFGLPISHTKDFINFNEKNVYIYKINHIEGILKSNMVATWHDVYTGDYVDYFCENEERYIWKEELEEYSVFYNLEYNIVEILEYKGVIAKGVQRFIDKFYEIKCNEKGAVKNGAKLQLNSSYGKLAQRIERRNAHYELAEEGYVHLVVTSETVDDGSMMSVVVGSRITALARVQLMQFIDNISQHNPAKNFIYCDTDSVHALTPYDNCDDKKLGFMKCEGIFENGLYLAPKTYLMNNGDEYEVHCKGVNTNVVKKELEGKTFRQACNIFKPNRTFKCLTSINTKGGKALVYEDKVIVNDENEDILMRMYADIEQVDLDPSDDF